MNVAGQAGQASRNRASSVRAAACLAIVATALAGCMTSKVDETRQVASAIQANESVVILT